MRLRYLFFVFLVVTAFAIANERPEVRAKPTAETVLRAEAIRRIYRPDTKVELDRLLEAVPEGDKNRIRDFLQGKTGVLSEAELRGLSDVYRRYQAKSTETQTALANAVKAIDTARLGELKRLVPGDFHDGLTTNTLQRLGLLESQKASGMSKVSLTTLPEGLRAELVGEGGPWERYLRANPEAKVADREAALTDLANLVDRAHKELGGEQDQGVRRLVLDLARIAAGDITVLREVSAIAPKLHSAAEGKNVAKTLDGLRTALLAVQYARGLDRKAARAELATQLAGGDRERAKTLESALERAEAKNDPELLKDVRERFKELVENEEALADAKNLDAFLLALDRRIAEEKGDALEQLRELRDYLVGKRTVLALNEIEAFRRMEAENKIATATCVLRAGGLRGPKVLEGAAAGLTMVLGMSPSQFQGLVAKLGGFRLPDKLLGRDSVAVAAGLKSSGGASGGGAQ